LIALPHDETFHALNVFRIEIEFKHFQIGTHVIGIGGSRERDHADVEGEAEHDLGRTPAVSLRDSGQFGMGQHLAVGARLEGELGLQEHVFAPHEAAVDLRRDCSPDRRFVVMTALIGGVDAAETQLQCELGKSLRIVFFPGRPVEESGDLDCVDLWSCMDWPDSSVDASRPF
jgi:hypothetical protein